MPRFVDHDQRRDEILQAAATVLAESGYARFSFRAIADKMGGSSTLVTHYFATRRVLLSAMIDRVFDDAKAEHDRLMSLPEGEQRLRAVLQYFLPNDRESAQQERIRIALLPYRDTDTVIDEFFSRLEVDMRDLLRAGISGLGRSVDEDFYVSVIRAWVNGLALSVVEHPELWAANCQERTTSWLMRSLMSALAPAADVDERSGQDHRVRSGDDSARGGSNSSAEPGRDG